MEKRINNKIQSFQQDFKEQTCNKINSLMIELFGKGFVEGRCAEALSPKFQLEWHGNEEEIKDNFNDIIRFIYDYDTLKMDPEDFTKRKRVKNHVPLYERCCALKSNGKQCTRRKKDNEEFCGTHIKGTPHGKINDTNGKKNELKKVQVFTKEIQGITYFIDKDGNVYDTHDIHEMKKNPKIITKYIIDSEGNYKIPTIFDN